jgi:Icc-related predicted phosphoesterase
MELNIFHTSDNHGKMKKGVSSKWEAKPIDLALLSGDHCPNYVRNFSFDQHYLRHVNRDEEKILQRSWNKKVLKSWLARKGWLDKTVICPGNHDFAAFHEFPNTVATGSKTITLDIKGVQVKIGILVGTNIIPTGGIAGGWYEEVDESEFERRIYALDSDIDILLSHRPPYGILDMGYGEHIGSQHLTRAIFGGVFGSTAPHFSKLKLHCFGHAHESGAQRLHHSFAGDDRRKGSILFSNAACSYEFLSIEV